MIKKYSHRELVEKIDDVICDCCGNSMKVEISPGIDPEFYGLVDQKYYGGYNSTHFTDGVRYDFDVCEECLAKWLKTFKVQPRETEDMGF